jgi:hypothetical protein
LLLTVSREAPFRSLPRIIPQAELHARHATQKRGGFIMIYSIFCTLNGKTIATIHGECDDDYAAIAKARGYLRSSAADTARVHRDAPLYPLGELIAELKADLEPGSEPERRFQAYFYSEADWARTTIEAATPELALQRARQIESEETETLDFQSYDSGAGVEHIESALPRCCRMAARGFADTHGGPGIARRFGRADGRGAGRHRQLGERRSCGRCADPRWSDRNSPRRQRQDQTAGRVKPSGRAIARLEQTRAE